MKHEICCRAVRSSRPRVVLGDGHEGGGCGPARVGAASRERAAPLRSSPPAPARKRRWTVRILDRMKVILPDSTELELPDGATGLDAARAIGPKLAEQAVLVRSNGSVHDLRLPLADGEQIQILTDARQGRPRRALRPAPLERAPARRGRPPPLPGREDRDRPADRERLLLRLRVPGADQRRRPRADRGRGRARARRGPRVDARGDLRRRGARRASAPRASRTRSSSSTPPRGRSASTRRATSPTSAAARTSRTRSRSRRSS